MLNDENIVFPFLRIRNVILENKKITIRGLISNKNFRTSDFDYTEFVKFYFIVAYGHSANKLVEDLQNPQARVQNVTGPTQESILNWENYFSGAIDEAVYDIKKITMGEIIAESRARSMDSVLFNSTETDMFLDNYNNLNFELDLELATVNTFFPELGLSEISENQVSLICFGHLDLRHIMSEYNIELYLSNLSQIGGNLTYDVLLDREDGILRVPATRNIFYKTEELNFRGNDRAWLESSDYSDSGNLVPYEGPVKYYSDAEPFVISEGPAPPRKTYSGWMSDPAGTLLTSRSIINRKVVSLLKYPPGVGITPSGFVGTDYPFDYSFYETPAGGSPDFLRSVHNYFAPNSEEILRNKMKKFSILSSKRASLNIVDYDSKQTWIQMDSLESELRPHHASFFSIKYEDLIRNNSPYGFFLEQWKNTSYVDLILSRCRILDLKIYCTRVTNDPVGNNRTLTSEYEYYDTDDEPVLLVRGEDARRSTYNLNLYQIGPDHSAKIREIDLSLPFGEADEDFTPESETKFLRDFIIKDFYLAQKQYGKYTYILDITVEDGIKNYILQLLNRFKFFLADYQRLLNISSIPVLNKKKVSVSTAPWIFEENDLRTVDIPALSLGQQGNYNFFTGNFTQDFKDTCRGAHSGVFTGLIESFSILVKFINKEMPLSMADQATLLGEIDPSKNGTLEKMNLFYGECIRLENMVSSLLLISPAGTNSDPLRQFDKQKSAIKSSESHTPGIFNVTANTGLIVDTFSGNTLFKEVFDFTQMQDIFVFDDLQSRLLVNSSRAGSFATQMTEYDNHMGTPLIENTNLAESPIENYIAPVSYIQFGFIGAPERLLTKDKFTSLSNAKRKAACLSIKSATRKIPGQRENIKFFSNHQASAIDNNFSILTGLTVGSTSTPLYPGSFSMYNSSILEEIKNMFVEMDPTTTPTKRPPISVKTAKKVCSAAVTSENKEEFLNNIKLHYKDLALSRKNLGTLFDKIMTTAHLYQDTFAAVKTHETWEDRLNLNEKPQRLAANHPTANEGYVNPFQPEQYQIQGFKRGQKQAFASRHDPFFRGSGRKMVVVQSPRTQHESEDVRLVNNVFFVEN